MRRSLSRSNILKPYVELEHDHNTVTHQVSHHWEKACPHQSLLQPTIETKLCISCPVQQAMVVDSTNFLVPHGERLLAKQHHNSPWCDWIIQRNGHPSNFETIPQHDRCLHKVNREWTLHYWTPTFAWYMARLKALNVHTKWHVSKRDWTMCSNHSHHSTFNSEHNREGLLCEPLVDLHI